MKVYVEEASESYQVKVMFEKYGYTVLDAPEGADLFCFVGGSDINPAFYKQEAHPETFTDEQHDQVSYDLWMKALLTDTRTPCVGICRGAQFLHAMFGYELDQHIEGHNDSTHPVIVDGVEIPAHSDHHQAMTTRPHFDNPPEMRVLGVYEGVLESVFHPKDFHRPPAFCYQPHPEWGGYPNHSADYFFNIIETKLLGE